MRTVLLVYKRSFFEKHLQDLHGLTPLSAGERRGLRSADREHRRTLGDVHTALLKRHLRVDVVYRGIIAPRLAYDLVVTVGGDGTFFMASHAIADTPILAVNSDPNSSLGLLCGADRDNFETVLDDLLLKRARVLKLNRLQIEVNGRRLPTLVTNDLLFANRNPAAMSRYRLCVGKREEVQRGSGIWVSTATGSTAAAHAAGGTTMPIQSRSMQFVVREPYHWPHRLRLLRGQSPSPVRIECLIPDCSIWVDGPHYQIDLALGDRVVIRTGATPLSVVSLNTRRRKLFLR